MCNCELKKYYKAVLKKSVGFSEFRSLFSSNKIKQERKDRVSRTDYETLSIAFIII